LLADIDELYDQFAWGIKKHPLSIRNFCDQLIDNNSIAPKFMLLLGKSVLSQNARSGAPYGLNLIPTYGEPASDQIFTSHLNTSKFTPEIATGRIAAQNDADVTAYLNKLISFELQQTLPPSAWMKNVLHFGGGTDLNEQNFLSSKLNVYKQIIEDTLFGGNVTTILKSSTAPIQLNLGQYIQQLIDTGCSMMTFYGHAAGTSFDISTDDPENYNNKDRYPVVLAQSCFVGDIHTTSRLLNERFVLTPEKGSIAFIAVPDKGLIDPLDLYSTRFHEVNFRDYYGYTVGEVMKKTVEDIFDSLNFDVKSVCMNMTLHGDPAIKMNVFEKPDYEIKNANIFYDPSIVTTEMDSFIVKFAIANLGKNTSETMHVLISRTMPSGIKRDTIIMVPYISYIDTLSITLPVDFKDGAGLNMFEITVDVYNEVDEIDNIGNNVANSQLLINSTDINPVFPQEYAIVPNGNIVLKATTADLFAAAKSYRFELDTSNFFNSPNKITGVVNNAFGIISWSIPTTLDSNIAYYWRVANDSIMSLDTAISSKFQWKVSSFLFKPGKTGWSQAHYYQFKESTLSNMLWVDSARQTKYISSNYSLLMTHEINRPSYEINGVNMDYGGCTGTPQIAVAVLDSINFEKPWTADSCVNVFGNFNSYSCVTGLGCYRYRADKYFLFDATNPIAMDSLNNFIQNRVPDGDYLLSWTTFSAPFSTLSNVSSAYNAIGVPQFGSLQNGDKFMMFMKKGDPSSVIFKKGLYPDSSLRIDYLLNRDWDKGFQSSSLIGPAFKWDQLHWNYTHLESGVSPDSIYLQVFGIATTGQEVLLMDSLVDITNPIDLSMISASTFPNLRLRSYMQDLQFRTPPQMEKWQVYFDPVPEGSLNTNYYSFFNDSVQEGETISLSMAFENISSHKMDTLLVDYFVYDANNIRRNISSVRLHRDLPAGDTIMCHVSFSSLTYTGTNSLWIEANPNKDQPEQYHFNNITSLKFTVTPDITNPLLDVTFDGLHILNGDIVSSRPEILMKLKDENKYLALNDTSNFRISLRSPSGQLQYLHFEPAPGSIVTNTLLGWLPAALPNNSFRIDYHPHLLVDGVYELAVEAKDETGNLSGIFDYKIQFEVINKSTITEVVNYPNPFSTSTRFVFMLTGSEVPTEFKIQIMTVTGKVVREIMREELGAIRIGRNITDYAWDGKDEFGDQLANGVYVYRVITGINGSDIEKRETNADQYFKNGWGKMYLMR
ncbi:MAG: C25 family cysteine peptidase, partial [Bacteroidia bacterium]